MGDYANSRPKTITTRCETCDGLGILAIDDTPKNYANYQRYRDAKITFEGNVDITRARKIRESVLKDIEQGKALNSEQQKAAIQSGQRLVMKPKPSDLADPGKVSNLFENQLVALLSNERVVEAVLAFFNLGIDQSTRDKLLSHIRGIKS